MDEEKKTSKFMNFAKTAGKGIKNGSIIAAGKAKGAATVVKDKVSEKSLDYKIKKLNPLFPDEYLSDKFNIPNVVIIVDDAVRRDIELCEGAMGWRDFRGDVEAMFLYDENIEMSGLTFLPEAVCDTAYYVDPHDRKTFIAVDSIFERVQREKIAELQDIAICLGAKSYTISLEESSKNTSSSTLKANLGGSLFGAKFKGSENYQAEVSSEKKSKSLTSAIIDNPKEPEEPKLKWFKNDMNLNILIKHILVEKRKFKNYILDFENSEYSAMSFNSASNLNSSLKVYNINVATDFKKKMNDENSKKMVMNLEF